MEITHDNFLQFCFIANFNKFTALTQFLFFMYTMKPKKLTHGYIFFKYFFGGHVSGAKGGFNLSDKVKILTFALYRLKYKFLFF